MTSQRISAGMDLLRDWAIGPEFEEFAVPAANAQCETLEAMRLLRDEVLAREQAAQRAAEEAARIEAQRLENERIAAEQAERQRLLDETEARLAREKAELKEAQSALERTGINPVTGDIWRLTDPQLQPELEAEMAAMKADPARALELLQSAGIANADGTLAEAYGGEPKTESAADAVETPPAVAAGADAAQPAVGEAENPGERAEAAPSDTTLDFVETDPTEGAVLAGNTIAVMDLAADLTLPAGAPIADQAEADRIEVLFVDGGVGPEDQDDDEGGIDSAPAVLGPPTWKLGEIGELFELKIPEAFLGARGFKAAAQAGRGGSARLYHYEHRNAICEAIAAHFLSKRTSA